MVRVVFLALLAGFVAPAHGSVSCETYDEDDCAADSNCFWVEAWDQCKDTCDGREDWQCHDHCTWSGDSCTASCNTAADEDSCTGDCNWKDDSCQGCNSDECGGCDDGDACEGCGTHGYESGWVTYGSWYDHGDGTSGDCHMNWYWKDYDEDEEDDGGDMTGLILGAFGVASAATTLGGLAVAMIANAAQGQCALGPTVGHAADADEPFYVAPQLCTIDGETFASDETVTGRTARKACKAYCSAAGLLVKKLELATCYCRKRR